MYLVHVTDTFIGVRVTIFGAALDTPIDPI